MWGSASADRSLIETQDTVLWLRLHLGGDASRLGLGCWTAVHPALSGSVRESPTCFGRPCTPGPDVPDGFGRIGAPSRGAPDACFGRHRIPARNARTCIGRHRRSARNARTCLGRHRRSVESPSRFGGPGDSHPAPRVRLRLAPQEGGRARGARFPIEAPPTSVDGRPITRKRLHRLRRVEVSHRLRPMRKVPSRIPTASAAGHGDSGHRATSGKPDGFGRRGSTPALLLRKRSGPRGDGASRPLKAKDANELVRDALRSPGQPGG
jgi:hypothetical protein